MLPNALNVAKSNSRQCQQLEQLLERSQFLQLTTSNEQYPNSKGSGLPLIIVKTPLCEAVIALQGAQLLEFKTTEGNPLFWLSPLCHFSPGVALRGGVPVCLPWFGPHPTDSSKPKHGFARLQAWELQNAKMFDDGAAELKFTFEHYADELFAFNFSAQLMMSLGKTVKLEILINNTDTQTFDCSWVLHSYFNVKSLQNVRIKGLANRMYLDNLENHNEKHQIGDVNFPNEVDRVYPNIENKIHIEDSNQITINHHNCPSVVVWNPGTTNAAKMADVGAGNEQYFVCVERGAVMQEKWNLIGGASESAWVEFKSESI